MNYRILGKTGFRISEVSLGTWQLGGKWGDPYSDECAQKILETAFENGINFFDTADVYNDGLSEASIRKFLKSKQKKIFVATKCGRKISPHVAQGYTCEKIEDFIDSSLQNLGVEAIDLMQLHCPPTDVFYRPEIFDRLEDIKKRGKILHYGVSVERVEEGLKALEYEGISSVQMVYNLFRQRPSELLLKKCREKNVGTIARVPLASGLLTGKFKADTVFSKDDHRFYNVDGSSFDKGETFSGVEYAAGLAAVEELKSLFGTAAIANYAIRWILMHEEMSCVITGASRAEQIAGNVLASDLPALSEAQMIKARTIYEKHIKNPVHYLW